MRVLVVVNPRATATSERQRDVLAHALGSSADLEVEETANRGHAAALACRAMRDGVDLVVALGGDGTVNEVVNGLLTDGVHEHVPALGVVPAGSTNVFARALGLPNDPIEATGVLLDALRHGRRRPISLGRIEDRWFTFAAGVGFDATVVAAVEKRRRRGTRSTHGLYARVTVREFLASDFDTGLDLYARSRMGVLSVVYSAAQMARKNPHPGGWGVLLEHDLPGFVVRSDEPILVQVDGDLLEPREKMQFWSVPNAVSLII